MIWHPLFFLRSSQLHSFNPSTVKVIISWYSSTGCTCYLHWCISILTARPGRRSICNIFYKARLKSSSSRWGKWCVWWSSVACLTDRKSSRHEKGQCLQDYLGRLWHIWKATGPEVLSIRPFLTERNIAELEKLLYSSNIFLCDFFFSSNSRGLISKV